MGHSLARAITQAKQVSLRTGATLYIRADSGRKSKRPFSILWRIWP